MAPDANKSRFKPPVDLIKRSILKENTIMKNVKHLTALAMLLALSSACFAEDVLKSPDGDEAYLFSSFRHNGEDGLRLAYSYDGLKWTALNDDEPYLQPTVGKHKLMRDPSAILGPDGMFHMVWTTSWADNGIGVAHSKDLINWSEQKWLPVMVHEPGAGNCWAPEIIWDPDGEQYLIYWSTTIRGRFPGQAAKGKGGKNHRIYYTTTKDFETYTDTELLYNPGFSVIDSVIIAYQDHYVMVSKHEDSIGGKNLHLATSDRMTGPWSEPSEPFSPEGLWVEGPTLLKVGDYYYVYFDIYKKRLYGALRTKDFETWEDVTDQFEAPELLRHGSTFPVPKRVLNNLLKNEKEEDS